MHGYIHTYIHPSIHTHIHTYIQVPYVNPGPGLRQVVMHTCTHLSDTPQRPRAQSRTQVRYTYLQCMYVWLSVCMYASVYTYPPKGDTRLRRIFGQTACCKSLQSLQSQVASQVLQSYPSSPAVFNCRFARYPPLTVCRSTDWVG